MCGFHGDLPKTIYTFLVGKECSIDLFAICMLHVGLCKEFVRGLHQ